MPLPWCVIWLIHQITIILKLTESTSEFKDNCNLVNIDLLLRQGLIDNTHPDYDEINTLLYAPATSS